MAAAREISSVVYLDVLFTYKIDGDCSYSITVYAPMIWIAMCSRRPRAYICAGEAFFRSCQR
jgi:hypothetical protein